MKHLNHLILFPILLLFYSCEKAEIPSLYTVAIFDQENEKLVSGGEIISDGGAPIIAKGVCWNLNGNPTIDDTKTLDGAGNANYSSEVKDLALANTYYLRAYAINSEGVGYGQVIKIITANPKLATIKTIEGTDIDVNSITLKAELIDNGKAQITEKGICWGTNELPTTSDKKVSVTSNENIFETNITNLEINTTYYFRSYAINSVGTSYGNQLSYKTKDSVVDVEGNSYKIVKIGDQIWMAENLKTTKYNDGVSLMFTSSSYDWLMQTKGAYCWTHDDPSYKNIYGAYYNFNAVKTGKLAPKGWRVPTQADWVQLQNHLGGPATSGGKLKSTGNRWEFPNLGASNESGFNALPASYRSKVNGTNPFVGQYSLFWSSTPGTNGAGRFMLYYYDATSNFDFDSETFGFNVRCIKE